MIYTTETWVYVLTYVVSTACMWALTSGRWQNRFRYYDFIPSEDTFYITLMSVFVPIFNTCILTIILVVEVHSRLPSSKNNKRRILELLFGKRRDV